jgi:membrane-associated phospholipid phosphatase
MNVLFFCALLAPQLAQPVATDPDATPPASTDAPSSLDAALPIGPAVPAPGRSESAAARRVRQGVARTLGPSDGPPQLPSNGDNAADAASDATTDVPPAQPAESTQPAEPSPAPATPTAPTDGAKAAEAPRAKRSFVDDVLARTQSGPLHYGFYYAPDYASVAVLGALSIAAYVYPPPVARRAAFGSSYDPDTRDASAVFAPRNDHTLGAPYRQDTVPAWAIPVLGNAALVGVGALSLTRYPSFRKVHHFVLGAAQAQLASFLSTELIKSAAGRLRPDFRDRMSRYYCAQGRGEVPAGTDCSAVNQEAASARGRGQGTSGIFIDRRELEDGRRSFPSGHAASSFVIASYLALFLGGEMVWGEHANAMTRLPGVAAQVAVMTAAAMVAASRITDGRHHPEDVVAGAGLGTAWAALFYFLHFDLLGRPLVRNVSLAPVAGRDGGLGLSLNGLLPF